MFKNFFKHYCSLRLPQKSILGFKVLSSFHSTLASYFLLLSGVLINPYFGLKYKEILSGTFFNLILNISLLILVFNIIDKRKQLNRKYFLTINSIIFISIPQIVFQIFINLKNLKILLTWQL